MILVRYVLALLLCITSASHIFCQDDSLEVFIIDSYVTPEKPHTLKLSFYTSEAVKSKILIDGRYTREIMNEFTEDHSVEIDFSNFKFNKKFIPYSILAINNLGESIQSETFELVLPYEEFIETKEGDDPISTILFGLLLYIIPSPNMVLTEDDNYFSLTKELPIITFYSSGYNYPSGTISIEYTHIYQEAINNYLRFGYKHLIPIDVFEYISPGITAFTNFNGFNGIAGELSLGLFNFYDVFTIYSRYRYNIQPDKTDMYFHEVSIGLYSNFFTIDL